MRMLLIVSADNSTTPLESIPFADLVTESGSSVVAVVLLDSVLLFTVVLLIPLDIELMCCCFSGATVDVVVNCDDFEVVNLVVVVVGIYGVVVVGGGDTVDGGCVAILSSNVDPDANSKQLRMNVGNRISSIDARLSHKSGMLSWLIATL